MKFVRLWHNLTHPFVVLFKKIVGSSAFKAFVPAAEALLKSKLGALALDAVQWAATLTSDGAGKRQAAFDKIVKDAKSQGVSYKDSIVNMLIEIAVQKIKGNA